MTPVSRIDAQKTAFGQTGYREPLILFLMFTIVLGLMVFWFIHNLRTWQASHVEHLLIRDLPVPVETLAETLAEAWDLDKTLLSGVHLHTPALLAASLISAQDNGGTLNQNLMLRARESTRHALHREPANASAWARLAFFRYFLDGSSTEVIEALRLSIYTAPADPYLIFWRLGLAAHNHAFWNDQMADLIRGQILVAWRANPRMLAQTAKSHGLLPITRIILATEPEQLEHLNRIVSPRVSP